MEKKPYKRLELDNTHVLEIFDDSRKIASDAYVVVMTARMKIPVEKSLFSEEAITDEMFTDVLETLGSPVVYEYRLERNMIMENEKDQVLAHLVSSFWDNMGQYIAKPKFPEKLVLKEYRQRVEKNRK
jgi:archaellum biogenesis ATPase FlaH